MRIVIPMAGSGDRFIRAGYLDPKPLIKVDGRAMIEHVIEMFPDTEDFVFICNRDHLRTSPLESVLLTSRPNARVVGIAPHKYGPVYTVCQALDTFDNDEEVIVNYCDFGVYWDHHDFVNQVRSRKAHGAMSAYRGFHPHSLGSTLYAYIREEGNWMKEIREKGHFTDTPMEEFASCGTYYFAKGEYIKTYFPELMRRNIAVYGEYYASMVYNLLQEAGLRTYIYEVEHFLQWGTPTDLEEYHYWSVCFRSLMPAKGAQRKISGDAYNLVLMAGRGMRFAEAGFTDPKPLIPVDGDAMILQAIRSLPNVRRWGFVCLKEHLDRYSLKDVLNSKIGDCDLIVAEKVTEGQACSALLAREKIYLDGPLLIAACDNGMIWDERSYEELVSDRSIDLIVWTFRNHPSVNRNPAAFSWVEVEGIEVKRVSVKRPISDTPRKDHAITGTFFFRRGRDFVEVAEEMIHCGKRVGGEFYIDDAVNFFLARGAKAVVFEVKTYLGWGTPDDLRTHHYWKEYFRKSHLNQRTSRPIRIHA